MKLELKENMYGRTIDGYIVKILNVKDDWIETDTRFMIRTFPQDFVKASYNIIDILEKGDYVNGRKVVEIFYDANDNVMDVCVLGSIVYQNNEIKSVITHEQMEQMAYKVGE